MSGLTDNPFGNCRIYYELIDGLHDDDEKIVGLNMHLKIGGSASNIYYDQFQVSLYGRPETVDSPNVEMPGGRHFIFRREVTRPPNTDWVDVHIDETFNPDTTEMRTLVLKLEATEVTSIIQMPPSDKRWQDQWYAADPAPWHVRLVSYELFGSKNVGKRVTPHRVVTDLVLPYFTVSGVTSTTTYDQLAFKQLVTRQEALDVWNEIEGYDYWVNYTDQTNLVFKKPGTWTEVAVGVHEPGISFEFTKNIDDVWNGVMVYWRDKQDRPHSVAVKKDAPGLGAWGRTHQKYTAFEAPESCKSRKQATKLGLRFLSDHDTASISGSLTMTGEDSAAGDALLQRPGYCYSISGAGGVPKKLKASSVTLYPLDWQSRIRFDIVPWRFDRYLKRLEAGVRARRR